MDENRQTVESYEKMVQEYIDSTPHDVAEVTQDFLDRGVDGLPKTARILEIGSAFGRDAAYLQSLGYEVECSDAPNGFVEFLRQKGFNARPLNVLTEDIGGRYDMILAIAVLLHIPRQEVRAVMEKIFQALNSGGRFVFMTRQGTGEKWRYNKANLPRYFCFWDKEALRALTVDAGFTKVRMDEKELSNGLWLQVIATK